MILTLDFDIKIVKNFYSEIPILGVCLGHQIIGQVFGSKIIQAKKLMHGKTSLIKNKKLGVLKGIKNQFPLLITILLYNVS